MNFANTNVDDRSSDC